MRITLLALASLLAVLIIVILLQSVDPKQRDPGEKVAVLSYPLSGDALGLDSLMEIAGTNKGLPPGFEKAALVAFSAYPQLRNVRIDMELTQSGAPMESSFDILTLFGFKEDRVYKIYLNDATNTEFNEILLRSLPFDAQIGILAHELGHVAYYHQLSSIEIAKWGLNYLVDEEFRAVHERSTDLMPVFHGLGSQILHYAFYVRNNPNCRDLYMRYRDFIDKYYMTDQELEQAMKSHPLYN